VLPQLVLTSLAAALALAEPDRLDIRFQQGATGAKTAPQFSPYGTQIPLTASAKDASVGVDALEGRLKLGSDRGETLGLRVVVARSESAKPYDQLIVDRNGDGSIDDETRVSIKPTEQRGNTWSSFSTTVKVSHMEAGQWVIEDYPLNLWIVVDKPATTPNVLRFSRQGHKVGPAMIDGVAMDVILSDSDNDGVFSTGDWWTVRPASTTSRYGSAENRKVGDFAWAGGKAWKLELVGTAGRSGRLVPFDPGISETQDEEARDLYRTDRLAPRAKTPLTFSKDIDRSLTDAKARKVPYFLDFETTWCGPCALMDKYVYTSEPVARAGEGIVCIKVDADDHKDLKAQFKVEAFPTGILFGADGREISRFTGYGSVKETEAFFRKARDRAKSD
jgi:thiol-disulfide isomerase/thioredoxin